MQPDSGQFTLRSLFVATALVACAVGAFVGYGKAIANAERAAIRNAIQEGRIDPEEYRDMLGDEVDELRSTGRKR